MVFELKEKVALVTGGASGIGFQCVKELLKHELRGVTIADVCPEKGRQALKEINSEFGANKAIFVQTDVANYSQFEESFKQTIKTFKNIDILINNAAIFNDSIWEKEIAININGTINGVLLALDNYIFKHKSGEEGVIANVSSIAGVERFAVVPVYTATKHAVCGMTRAWGDQNHYERTKIKVIGMCPGVTNTPVLSDLPGKNLGYDYLLVKTVSNAPIQEPECVAEGMMKIIQHAKSGSLWIAEGGEEPYEFVMPDRTTFKSNRINK